MPVRKLAFIAAVALTLFSCGRTRPARLSNPMESSTLEQIEEKLGIQIGLPADANVLFSYIISGKTAQVKFFLLSEGENTLYTLRIQKGSSSAQKDISGLYYSWRNEEQMNMSGCRYVERWNTGEENVRLGCWWDEKKDLSYSLSSHTVLEGKSLQDIASFIQKFTEIRK